MSRPHWYRGVASQTVRIACSGGVHRLSWRRGRLSLRDHDREAESALGGLGGKTCECIETYEAWHALRDHSDALRLAADSGLLPMESVVNLNIQRLGSMLARYLPIAKGTPPAPQSMTVPGGVRVSFQSGMGQAAARLQDDLEHQQKLARLASLPPPLRDRFSLETFVHCLRRMPDERFLELRARSLEDALASKANPALRGSMERWRRLPPSAEVTVETWMSDGGPPVVTGWLSSRGGLATATLPFDWLVEIWGRGMATIDGCFVLQSSRPEPGRRDRALAVRWERQHGTEGVSPDWYTPVVAEAEVTRLPSGRWRLRWL